MAISDIPIAELIVPAVDINPMNNSIKIRTEMLASQLNEKAAAEIQAETKALQWKCTASGNSIKFELEETEMPFVNVLAGSPGIPVSGGDNGTAHNPDGSTYTSKVPKRLQGTPLPEYALPSVNIMEEITNTGNLLAPEAVNSAVNDNAALNEAITNVLTPEIEKAFKG